MSHVDEGQIHAYLDRQLEFAERAAREKLEAHIAQCPECSARVEEARTIHARSAALLHQSQPEKVEPPPFERLATVGRNGAAVPTKLGTLRRTRTYAWAASIVMAIAVGWYARVSLTKGDRGGEGPIQVTQETRALPSEPQVASTVAAEPIPSTAPPIQPRPALSQARAEPRTLDEAGAPAALAAALEQESVLRGAIARANQGGPGERPDADTVGLLLAERSVARGDRSAASDVDRPELRRAVDEIAQLPPSPSNADSAPAERLEADAVRLVANRGVVEVAAWRDVKRDVAEELLGAPVLAVAGLPVVSISIPAGGEGGQGGQGGESRIVRVSQLLPSGDSLELLQRHASATAGLQMTQGRMRQLQDQRADAFFAGTSITTLSTSVGELVLTGRAALSPDSLRTLLGQLRESPRPD